MRRRRRRVEGEPPHVCRRKTAVRRLPAATAVGASDETTCSPWATGCGVDSSRADRDRLTAEVERAPGPPAVRGLVHRLAVRHPACPPPVPTGVHRRRRPRVDHERGDPAEPAHGRKRARHSSSYGRRSCSGRLPARCPGTRPGQRARPRRRTPGRPRVRATTPIAPPSALRTRRRRSLEPRARWCCHHHGRGRSTDPPPARTTSTTQAPRRRRRRRARCRASSISASNSATRRSRSRSCSISGPRDGVTVTGGEGRWPRCGPCRCF